MTFHQWVFGNSRKQFIKCEGSWVLRGQFIIPRPHYFFVFLLYLAMVVGSVLLLIGSVWLSWKLGGNNKELKWYIIFLLFLHNSYFLYWYGTSLINHNKLVAKWEQTRGGISKKHQLVGGKEVFKDSNQCSLRIAISTNTHLPPASNLVDISYKCTQYYCTQSSQSFHTTLYSQE